MFEYFFFKMNENKKNFKDKYDSIINLIGYIDNKGYENTNLKSITNADLYMQTM